MESENGRANHSLEEALFGKETACEFEFFQAVRLLNLLSPARNAVGHGVRPCSEVVRFSSVQSLSFPASEIHEIRRPTPVEDCRESDPPTMTVAFMGLTGPQGTLPAAYSEEVLSRNHKKKSATAAFFDIFNHRLISLFYRVWEKHHVAASFEKGTSTGLVQYLFDLLGMGTEGLRNRLLIADQALLPYAGLLAQRPRSAAALEGILRDYFTVPVGIEQFRGQWFALADESLSYMEEDGPHNALGGAVAGDAAWNPQAGIRIVLGPLGYERFVAFLPGKRAALELNEIVGFFLGPRIQFDVQLILLAGEVPVCEARDDGHRPPMLGLTSWLGRETDSGKDEDDLILPNLAEAA